VKGWGLSALLVILSCGRGGTTWLGSQDAAGAAYDAAAAPPANFFARYEAESALNTATFPVEGRIGAGNETCAQDGVMEGANCASNGQYVDQILGRSPCQPPTSKTSFTGCQNIGGGVLFNGVTVPVDGTYDVTWWYHCGEDPSIPGRANVFGDTQCGGLDYGTGAGSGCRPHLIDVNGVPMSSTVAGTIAPYFQFPCYPGPWSILHGATTALHLNAGANTIYIHAPGVSNLAAADMDALDVHAAGHGVAPPPLWPRLVTPVQSPD
jgi:hypothetical protein